MIDIERFVNILIDFIGLAKQYGTQCLCLQTESLSRIGFTVWVPWEQKGVFPWALCDK